MVQMNVKPGLISQDHFSLSLSSLSPDTNQKSAQVVSSAAVGSLFTSKRIFTWNKISTSADASLFFLTLPQLKVY